MKVCIKFTKTEIDYRPAPAEKKYWPPVTISMEGNEEVIKELLEKLAEMGEIE